MKLIDYYYFFFKPLGVPHWYFSFSFYYIHWSLVSTWTMRQNINNLYIHAKQVSMTTSNEQPSGRKIIKLKKNNNKFYSFSSSASFFASIFYIIPILIRMMFTSYSLICHIYIEWLNHIEICWESSTPPFLSLSSNPYIYDCHTPSRFRSLVRLLFVCWCCARCLHMNDIICIEWERKIRREKIWHLQYDWWSFSIR